ncbi:MAG TPA: glycoside hydrolase family 3 C-terminal domain-containing protein [Terracidiphilus sp.]|jgi:beta-glucosidase|nr:glycoside hydrolase family 3 C-terminal domain-containing protein [Terracidiphilus sp.]
MKKSVTVLAGAALAACGFLVLAAAQETQKDANADAQKPAYMDSSLSPEQRAADLVHRMTLEEKASQLVNQARAIPRLNVPAYDWWSESLHGVASQGVTEFPEPIGLAATFDAEAIHQMATDIGIEGRIKHQQFLRENGGYSKIFQGLDFWAPNINIFRDPRWGRGQETYGEDPYLTGRMAVAFVTGMQGDDPHYYRVISTPKHFVVHSGPEPTRHFADVDVSKHDEEDTYLPAFRAAVTEGHADSVMCAYNAINGQPACANQFTLIDQLRNKWGFKGYVVSDCGAVIDIFEGHRYRPTQAQASAISLERGMDNECADFTAKVTDNHDYKPYIDAVREGYLSENSIDTALVRLFTARMKLGMFDPPSMVPYANTDEKQLNSPEHRELAHKLADESMVLLKNDGTLPLKPAIRRIAVIGPLADETRVLLGNYNGQPTHTVSILEGIRKEFTGAQIEYLAGTQFLSHEANPVPNAALTTGGKPGVKATYTRLDMTNLNHPEQMKQLAQRVEPNINPAAQPLPPEAANVKPLAIRYEAMLTAPTTGDYNLGMKASGFFRMRLNGKSVTSSFGGDPNEAKLGRVHLEAGQPAALVVEYADISGAEPHAQLVWSRSDMAPDPKAIEAARKADVVVAVVGITSQLEGEEMQVSEPGFLGGDRTSLDLPEPEENLLEALARTHKPLVVVLTNGSALAVNWANDHANAILDAWYPGEEGGTAVADTLSGKNNPAGRLPVTFYTGVAQLPHFEDYSMRNRTYRYFRGKPLYPFGYGLSYTRFSYSELTLPTEPIRPTDAVNASVTVTNSGSVAGDEVVQLYVSFPDVKGAPMKALRGFRRIHLDAGASQKVEFTLKDRDLGMVTELGQPMIAEGQYTVSIGGGQPDSGAPSVSGKFHVKQALDLPE